jgi:uncharacterized protein (TIGR03118 family)
MRFFIRELQQTSGRAGRRRQRRERRVAVELLEERALLSTAAQPHGDHGHAMAVDHAKKAHGGYSETNLVSDLASEVVQVTDPNLKNPWGMAYVPVSSAKPTGSAFWISAAATGVSTIYTVTPSNVVTIAPISPVTIPGGGPTGQVANTTTSFVMANTKPASFIFDTLGGTVSAWNGGSAATIEATTPGATYTGLAIGSSGGQNYLYAANGGSSPGITVFNSSFTPVTLAGSFVDPKLTKGFAKTLVPYNIQNIDGELFVTYRGSSSPSAKGGAVAEFNTDGTFVRQIAYNKPSGKLQAPWGVTLAPASFGKFSNDLLVGNFANGRINAYNAVGKFAGQLNIAGTRKPLVIPGLWALDVGNGGNAGSSSMVYFTAGINDQSDGLFGALQPVSSSSTSTAAPASPPSY